MPSVWAELRQEDQPALISEFQAIQEYTIKVCPKKKKLVTNQMP